MAFNLDQIRAIQHSIGSPSEPETRRMYAKHIVERDFFKSLDVDKFLLFDQRLTNTEYYLNVFGRKYSHYDGVEQTFTCPMEVNIEAGDIVYNPAQDEYWIIYTSSPVDYIYRTGRMILCDTFIKWQDINGNIWTYPVVDNNTTQYNSGVYQGKYVDYVTSQHRLTTVADVNICALKIDTRFFLGKVTSIPEVFRLTQIDTTSLGYGKGIAQLTVLRSTYNPETDDINTGICRTKEPIDENESEHGGNIAINYNGEPNVYIGGTKRITALTNTADPLIWSVNNAELEEYMQLKRIENNIIEISFPVIDDDILPFIGKSFELICHSQFGGDYGTQTFTILGGA